jgi:hypothetical protein
MPMPMIDVVRPFMLQLEPKQIGEAKDLADPTKTVPVYSLPDKIFFAPGVHDVTDEVAEHWYTKAHLEGYKEPPKGPGTAEYQIAQAVAEQPAAAVDPADPVQPAPEASTAPRPAAPPPSAERSVPRRVAR